VAGGGGEITSGLEFFLASSFNSGLVFRGRGVERPDPLKSLSTDWFIGLDFLSDLNSAVKCPCIQICTLYFIQRNR